MPTGALAMTTPLKLRHGQLTWPDEKGLNDLIALTAMAEQLRPAGAVAVGLERADEGFAVHYFDTYDQAAGTIGFKRGTGRAWLVQATSGADWAVVPAAERASRRRPG